MPVLPFDCHLPTQYTTHTIKLQQWRNNKTIKSYKQLIYFLHISCKCDTNRAGHFTLDAHASRPVACLGLVKPHGITQLGYYFGSGNGLSHVRREATMLTKSCLKSSTPRLFTQPFIQAQIKVNIKAPRHWPCAVNSPVTGEFPAQMASNVESVSIWWRHIALEDW